MKHIQRRTSFGKLVHATLGTSLVASVRAGTGPTQGTSATTGTCAGVSPARGTTQAPSSELAKTGNHHGGEDAPVAGPRSALRAPHAPSSARGAKTRWVRGDPRADAESARPFPARATSSEQRKTANTHRSRDAPAACPQSPIPYARMQREQMGAGAGLPYPLLGSSPEAAPTASARRGRKHELRRCEATSSMSQRRPAAPASSSEWLDQSAIRKAESLAKRIRRIPSH